MITIEEQGPVAVVRYDRGERRNALSMAAMEAMTRTAHELAGRFDITAVVLTGTSREFSSGVDTKDLDRWAIEHKSLDEQRHITATGTRMCKAWEDLPQLTIAAVEGLAIGGGVALMLACDWRVMAEDAFLGVPEVQLGMPLIWGTIPRLVALVGPSRAKQVMLLGDRIDSATAKAWGLVDSVASPGNAVAHAQQMAAKVCTSQSHVVKMSKQTVNAYANVLAGLGSHMEVDQMLLSRGYRARPDSSG